MFPTIHTTQVFTPVGGGYVAIQHSEPASRNLPADLDDVVQALRSAMFREVVKSLRAMLYLN
jgi:hypothetical protein